MKSNVSKRSCILSFNCPLEFRMHYLTSTSDTLSNKCIFVLSADMLSENTPSRFISSGFLPRVFVSEIFLKFKLSYCKKICYRCFQPKNIASHVLIGQRKATNNLFSVQTKLSSGTCLYFSYILADLLILLITNI